MNKFDYEPEKAVVLDCSREIMILHNQINKGIEEESKLYPIDVSRKIITEIVDNYLNAESLYITTYVKSLNEIIHDYRHLLKRRPVLRDELHDLADDLSLTLNSMLELPTWEIMFTRWHTDSVLIELCGDFRIHDWMRRHYKRWKRRR